jgi:ubiquinone/menaquinone biosynthesis C-methylase UbiE
VGKLPQIDYPDKSFDIVVATETLEHLDDPEFLLREMKRVARKKVIVSVPNNTLPPSVEKEHRQVFTRFRLNEMLSKYFTKVEIEEFRDEFPTPKVNISLPTLLAVCEVQ